MTPHAKWAIAGIIIGLILFAVACGAIGFVVYQLSIRA